MSLNFARLACPCALACVAAAVLSLAGCGGGGTTAPAADQSVSGVVIDGPILGATVCLDLNSNGACGAGEPTSGATDAQGNFTISGLTAQQVAGAPLVAVVPATASDSGVLVGTAYQLTAPAGRGAVISPITTLVQTAIAQGMTPAAAEAAVAAQLQVAAASLYNNFVASTSGDNATLASVAPITVSSLKAGEALVVSTPTASAADYWVRLFEFTDSGNYYLRYFYAPNVPDSTGTFTYYEERVRWMSGSPLPSASLYDTTLVATATGWRQFDGASPSTSTNGSPYVATWGNGFRYSGTRVETDVSGLSIASVVAMVQDTAVNTSSTVVGVGQPSGTMPAGAKIRRTTLVNTATPVKYRVSDGFVSGVNDLAGLVAAYPAPGTPTVSNTASMFNLHGYAGCGQTICLQEALRVAFGASNAATYYLCDLDTSNDAHTNCGAIGTGTYSLVTADDGSTPLIKFAGLPAATSVQTFTRVFVQRDGHVYYGWQEKPDATSTTTRLNKVAFEALAQALGVAAPTFSAVPSVYVGTWSAAYTGSDTGTCGAVDINAVGHISGSCTSTGVGGTFVVTGSVTSAGVASFTASGFTNSGAVFSGSLTTSAGSGTWAQASTGFSGNWTATRP